MTTSTMWQRVRQVDAGVRERMREHGPTLLRLALGMVFVWFGALKVIGRSPVAGLVATTLPFMPADAAVIGLGVVEILVGLGLLTRIALRPVLVVFWLQLAGTFLVFIVAPSVAFQDRNPLLLTREGEFIVKNIVLIAAGIVVGGRARRLPASPPLAKMRKEP